MLLRQFWTHLSFLYRRFKSQSKDASLFITTQALIQDLIYIRSLFLKPKNLYQSQSIQVIPTNNSHHSYNISLHLKYTRQFLAADNGI